MITVLLGVHNGVACKSAKSILAGSSGKFLDPLEEKLSMERIRRAYFRDV